MLINLYSDCIATNQLGLNTILNPFELYTLPLEDWITNSVDYLVTNYRPLFQAIGFPIGFILETIKSLFLAIPPLIFLILLGLLAWQLAGVRIASYSVVALSLIGLVGAWEPAIVSLSLVLTAVAFCMVVGISLGILSASNQRLEKWLQPILDTMQTLPSFVYLVPVVMLFGLGEVPGVIATFIFAVPPLVRLTSLGIRQVSEEAVEAATAFGSTPRQMMWDVQIPLAMPTILAGVNQAILLALSMSVVTSMINVKGLGFMVLQGLGQLNVGQATVGGLSIVLIAIMLDRMTHLFTTDSQISWKQRPPFSFFFSPATRYWAIFASTILVILLVTSIWTQIGLEAILNPFQFYTLPLQDWITNSVDYLVNNYRPVFQAIRFPISFTLEVIKWFLLAIPPLIFLILLGLLAWQLAGVRIAVYSIVAMSLIGFVGAWEPAIVLLSLVLTSVAFCMLVGISLGILSASNQRLEKWLQPILDAMQTLPSFVYLVPVVMLFGIGEVSGVIATFVFAVPPLVRLTSLGIRQVSEEAVEAATAFGSTPRQMMWDVQIPLAMPTILAGVNQAILLALSMSVVTSMIGVKGLGGIVLRGLSQANVGIATVGGLGIVLIAIMLDRMTHLLGSTDSQISWQQRPPISFFFSQSKRYWAIFVATILSILLVSSIWIQIPQLFNTGLKIQSAHSTSQEERFQTEIINIGLRKLGYKTPEPLEIEYTTMHVALGHGDLDYTGVHWEKGHTSFFEKGGGGEKLERVGVISRDLLQGYQIDKKTADKYNITNLGQLKDPEIAKIFDTDGDGKANLTGCNSGWGCELAINHHLKAYGLEDTVEQDQGTYSTLIVDTITRFNQGQPVLYYTWTPMWMAGVLKVDKDVIWLEVPFTSLPEETGKVTKEDTTAMGKNLGFAIDDIRILANKEFLSKNPGAKRLFELVKIPVDDISLQNEQFKNGENSIADIRRHAQEWVKNHQDEFDGWVAEAKKAASSNPQ